MGLHPPELSHTRLKSILGHLICTPNVRGRPADHIDQSRRAAAEDSKVLVAVDSQFTTQEGRMDGR